jgi:Asp-tRNA(Asn)/Glu-tRNA(Gln) amidotransferase B subunit
MNSFNAMSRAVDFEIERQTALYRAGQGLTLVHFSA